MLWQKQMEELRGDFVLSARRYPHFEHCLIAVDAKRDDIIAQLQKRELSRPRGSWDARIIALPGGPTVTLVHDFRDDEVQADTFTSAHKEFVQLATRAGRLTLKAPPSVRQRIQLTDEAHPDAGVVKAMLVTTRFIRRVELDLGVSPQEAEPHPDDALAVVDVRGPDDLWCLLLHTLGLHATEDDLLASKIATWHGNVKVGLPREVERWRPFLDTQPFPWAKGIELPLQWVKSKLSDNVFRCSAWAIDELLGTLPPDDCTLRVKEVATITGYSTGNVSRMCDDGTLQHNGKSGPERRVSQGSVIKLQLEMKHKVKIVPTERGRRRS